LYQDIVFEFKRDLRLEGEKGREELERYLRSLGNKQVFFGVFTDGLVFEAYLLEDDGLTKIDQVVEERSYRCQFSCPAVDKGNSNATR
jgi:hypothetical protein